MDIFADWRDGATSLVWRSTTEANDGADVTVFVRRTGTPGAPALVCVHGFPTSSIDYYGLARELAAEFDIFVLDFPGYGLSDKPPAPYVYSLFDDARLLVHAITEVWKLTDYLMVTHDRGSSVGMIALDILAAQHPGAVPADVVMTNANIYLPLANLTAFQTALLDDATGRATAAVTTPELLAAGLGASTFMPRRTLEDPEIAALAKCFAHNDGIRVLPDTIAYLHERASMKPVGSKHFPRATSTSPWCGACMTTSRRFASPTTCGRRTSKTSRDETATGCCPPPTTTCNVTRRLNWRRSSG